MFISLRIVVGKSGQRYTRWEVAAIVIATTTADCFPQSKSIYALQSPLTILFTLLIYAKGFQIMKISLLRMVSLGKVMRIARLSQTLTTFPI